MIYKTLVLKTDPHRPKNRAIHAAADIIRKGGLVAFPTETVYGLGTDALNPDAIKSLFRAKKRPFDNPPIVHVGRVKEVYRLAGEVSPKAEMLINTFWPGPLTLIFKASEIVPDVTICGLDTIAIRMPRHNVALALIKESNRSIAAPSANIAGKPSPTTAKHVLDDLEGRIDVVLDAGPTNIGVESTVLDTTVDPPEILRPGGTEYEALYRILGKVKLHSVPAVYKEASFDKARSPGMKHKHYAPSADVIVVEGNSTSSILKVKELAELHMQRGKRVGILTTNENANRYRAHSVKSLGSRNKLAIVAKNLFRLLREFDVEDVDVIIAESVPSKGLGLAVMNRLRKASEHNIVRVHSH